MVRFKVTGPDFTGHVIEAEENSGLLTVLERNGYTVPHLCYHEAVSAYGACRLCLVEVEKRGKRKLTTACNYPVKEGIHVHLDTQRVVNNRKVVIQLLLSMSPHNGALIELARRHDVPVDDLPFPGRENNDCILCGLCERICAESVKANAITFVNRGDGKAIDTPYGEASDDCIGCLSCAHVCPTGHIQYEDTPLWRTIWYRTHDKVRCTSCGKSLITVAQRDHLAGKGLSADYFELCDECKRPKLAAQFASVGK